ncbi:hypothetical protein B0H14DRAFT_3131662 [Mycena olivaceomarginata]|nr:hypothetical protein B0H14DRAFT_3131662 [Mycena olivaceomarginata]
MGRFGRCGTQVEGTSPPHLPPRRRPLRSTRRPPPPPISSSMGRFERCGAKVEGTSPPHLPARRRPLRSTRTAPPWLISTLSGSNGGDESPVPPSTPSTPSSPAYTATAVDFRTGFCAESGAEWLKLRGIVAPTFPRPVDTFVSPPIPPPPSFPVSAPNLALEGSNGGEESPVPPSTPSKTLVPRVYRRRCRFPVIEAVKAVWYARAMREAPARTMPDVTRAHVPRSSLSLTATTPPFRPCPTSCRLAPARHHAPPGSPPSPPPDPGFLCRRYGRQRPRRVSRVKRAYRPKHRDGAVATEFFTASRPHYALASSHIHAARNARATQHVRRRTRRRIPCEACELVYDLFVTETLFDPSVGDETSALDVVNALAKESCGEVLRSDCCLQSLLEDYMDDRNPQTGDNPRLDLNALACPPRRSARIFAARLADEARQRQAAAAAFPTSSTSSGSAPSSRPRPSTSASSPSTSAPKPPRGKGKSASGSAPKRRGNKGKTRKSKAASQRRVDASGWVDDASGELKQPEPSWDYTPASALPPPLPPPPLHPSLPARPASLPALPTHPSLPKRPADAPPPGEPPAKRARGNVPAEKRAEEKAQRAARRGDFLTSNNFSLLENASVASTGWQGAAPPRIAREQINSLYGDKPDARGLHKYLKKFYPCYYDLRDSPSQERATFFVDRDGLIFMYRSFRIAELMHRADEIQRAHDILVGSDQTDPTWQKHYLGGQRGDHIAIIFGHHRQSAQAPRLTKWHLDHMDRVNAFMELPVVKTMIGLVSDIVATVFPGVAARFLADADWHWRRHQTDVRPLLRRIHCRPHADKKNQIGVCVLLIYALKTALQFDHRKYTWLVIWEAGVAVELPPWVILIYPSALFYHFNLDVSQIQFVTTDGYVRPTPENSCPIISGDNEGRGSFVFFNQSTMRTGPETGRDTLKAARAAGHSGISDFGASAQEAFSRPEYFHKISPLFWMLFRLLIRNAYLEVNSQCNHKSGFIHELTVDQPKQSGTNGKRGGVDPL